MAYSIQILRLRAAMLQGFRCYYCELRIWLDDPGGFAARYKLTTRQARPLRCTAEHLQARADGGSNRRDNVVAACRYCNSRRHRTRTPLSPPAYRAHVRRRMQQGKWLAAQLPPHFVRLLTI
jgi:5-methylcytosine-specific restriction endonuclease McrA